MTSSKERPNILYIHSHDTGRYIQPYGYAVPTPNLQRLAEDGVLFRQAFCSSPTCSPSRSALLTGQYPHQNGMTNLAHRGGCLKDYRHHLIHSLKPAGYYTALCGVQHVAHGDQAATRIIGYDQELPAASQHVCDVVPEAVKLLSDPPNQPFFLSVGFIETHRIGDGFTENDGRTDPRYVRPPEPLPDSSVTRRDFADYIESARVFDNGVGEVLDALDRFGLADSTLVICTTDHGIAFPRMKCNLEDSGTGVMLIMRGPAGFSGGKVIDAMVTHLDIFPTLCELLDIAPPARLEGRSLLPLQRGDTGHIHEAIFGEINHHGVNYIPMRSVRTSRWKYIRRYDGRNQAFPDSCDDGTSKRYWLNSGWGQQSQSEEQLFDLVFDPNEARNLIGFPDHHSVLIKMRKELDKWMQETDDFLGKNKIK
jgi:arylsulfatase A-like enzyme